MRSDGYESNPWVTFGSSARSSSWECWRSKLCWCASSTCWTTRMRRTSSAYVNYSRRLARPSRWRTNRTWARTSTGWPKSRNRRPARTKSARGYDSCCRTWSSWGTASGCRVARTAIPKPWERSNRTSSTRRKSTFSAACQPPLRARTTAAIGNVTVRF